MAKEGFIQGAHGEEISLLVDGIKIMALQNLSWKASQSKSVIRGAGYRKPHAMGRGPKDYEVDFEVKELNKAIIEEAINSPRSRPGPSGSRLSPSSTSRNCVTASGRFGSKSETSPNPSPPQRNAARTSRVRSRRRKNGSRFSPSN